MADTETERSGLVVQIALAPDLTACDREPIHIPGAIQPHGLLLVADGASLEVIGVAGDIEGRLAADWNGATLSRLLGRDVGAEVGNLIASRTQVAVIRQVAGVSERFDATMRLASGLIVVELESAAQPGDADDMLSTLDEISATFDDAHDFQELCNAAASAFRELTGFDRVMIYRFLDDAAGAVVAENQDPELHSFLNHRFPAADIPVQARALYVRNRIRVIPDVGYEPAPLRWKAGVGTLDMSDLALRSVSPIHIQYLKNMAVAASASVSIVLDGRLWGLVACHHHGRRELSHGTRVACATLARTLARQIKSKDDAESYRQRLRLRSQEDAVIAHLGNTASLGDFFGECGMDLCRMLDASAFAAVQGDDLYTAGKPPGDAAVRAVAAWVRTRALEQPFHTGGLGAVCAAARPFEALASGLLAATLSTEEPMILMWFRAEQKEIVNWAGNPHKEAGAADAVLTPRASFAAWSEAVRGRSTPWTLPEVEAAGRVRRALFDVRRNRRLRALNLELSATIADNESLLVQKDFLVKEVHHRVQNSLTLVSAFLGIQSRAVGNEVLTAQFDEARRRLTAVSLVHRRLYSGDQLQTVDLARYLEDLCSDTMASMGPEWQNHIRFDLAPIVVATDRAVNVGLILTELLINANKYAYSGSAGPIAVKLDRNGDMFRLSVADRGAGKVRTQVGFGTRMLNSMVQSLSGALAESDNLPGLKVVVSAPIEISAAPNQHPDGAVLARAS